MLASDPRAVRHSVKAIASGLARIGLSQEEIGNIQLVLAEVMNNIVEHACADRQDGVIDLCITPSQGEVKCRVIDDGKPLPGGVAPAGRAPDHECASEDLAEGGFGWYLIHKLVEDLATERIGAKNHLWFSLPAGGGSRADATRP